MLTLTPLLHEKKEIKKEKKIQRCKIIEISTKQDKEQTIVIVKTSTPPVFKHFQTQKPDLIVIDFLDTECEYIKK